MEDQLAEPKNEMDINFALFNCHINRAKERAIGDTINKFGVAEYDKQLAENVENGIMAIFKKKPTEVTMYFVLQVQKYVNE